MDVIFSVDSSLCCTYQCFIILYVQNEVGVFHECCSVPSHSISTPFLFMREKVYDSFVNCWYATIQNIQCTNQLLGNIWFSSPRFNFYSPRFVKFYFKRNVTNGCSFEIFR